MDKPSAFTCYIDGNVVKPDFVASTTDLYEAAAIAICYVVDRPEYETLAADTPLVIQFADSKQAGGKVLVDEVLEWTKTPAAASFLEAQGAAHAGRLAHLAATLL